MRCKLLIVLNCSCLRRATSFLTVSMHSLKIFSVASISACRVCRRELTMLLKSRLMSIFRCSSFSIRSCCSSNLLSMAWAIRTKALTMHSCIGNGFTVGDACSIKGLQSDMIGLKTIFIRRSELCKPFHSSYFSGKYALVSSSDD